MKKENLSNLSVKRISTSPYFSQAFAQLEKKTIKEISGAHMLESSDQALADILITNTHTDPNKIPPEQMKATKLIIHPNSGYDNFSCEFIKNASFPVIIGNPIRAQAVSNYILSALFSHYSKLPKESLWNESRAWPRKLISELKVLIIGAGHIGTLLSQSIAPLVSHLNIYDPHKNQIELELENTDVVILACGLNKENYHFVNSEFLNELNDDFLLINAARGSLVKTEDLLSVLKQRPKAHAVLDVYESEPADFNLFHQNKNIITTSHIAGVYQNIDQATATFVAQVILDFKTLEEKDFLQHYKATNLLNRLSENKDFLI